MAGSESDADFFSDPKPSDFFTLPNALLNTKKLTPKRELRNIVS
jgi:hypothetical protein